MPMEMGLERDVLGSLYHRQPKNSSIMKNALALNHSYHVHGKEPKSYTTLKALVTDILEDQQQVTVMPVVPVKGEGDG